MRDVAILYLFPLALLSSLVAWGLSSSCNGSDLIRCSDVYKAPDWYCGDSEFRAACPQAEDTICHDLRVKRRDCESYQSAEIRHICGHEPAGPDTLSACEAMIREQGCGK